MQLTEMVDGYVLGRVLVDELPTAAVQALEDGYDSPSLRQLAGADTSDPEGVRSLFLKALGELKLSVPSPQEAGLSFARSIAREVIRGSVLPYEGARRIWHEIYTHLPELKELKLFVGLASEYEDDERHRDSYSAQIVDECRTLVGE